MSYRNIGLYELLFISYIQSTINFGVCFLTLMGLSIFTNICVAGAFLQTLHCCYKLDNKETEFFFIKDPGGKLKRGFSKKVRVKTIMLPFLLNVWELSLMASMEVFSMVGNQDCSNIFLFCRIFKNLISFTPKILKGNQVYTHMSLLRGYLTQKPCMVLSPITYYA